MRLLRQRGPPRRGVDLTDGRPGQLLDVDAVLARGYEAGLDAVAVTHASPFTATRAVLEERREAGLHGGMQFTYRNPSRSTDPARTVAGVRALVVGARRYPGQVSPPPEGEPTGRVARYASADHYAPLRAALESVAGLLRDTGWAARVLADDNALVDRAAARRAGLGWFGRNTNLLLPGAGSWFVLGAVATDCPLVDGDIGADPDPPRPSEAEHPGSGIEPDDRGCGSCTRCLTACPTGALVAPGVLDARRCLAWLLQQEGSFPREHRRALGDRIYGCDECSEVCPPNRVPDRADPSPSTAEGRHHVAILELLGADDDELLARWGRWYIPRRDPRYLRRNALVVLGNVGRGDDPRVVEALVRHLEGPDPLLRAHAVWAARAVGRPDLVDARAERLAADPDPLVRDEVAATGVWV